MVERERLLLNDEDASRASQRRGTALAMRKVVLVGDTGVGKTAILSRFING